MNEEGRGEDEHRHRCLVRHVIKKRLQNRDDAHKFFNGWNEKHPKSILEADVRDQWAKGNKGNYGDWK